MSIKKKIKPMGNRIVVQREEAKTSKGGILLPGSAQKKPREGVVVAVGPGKSDDSGKMHPIDVKVGEKVLFSSYGGTEYKLDDDIEYVILSEEDVLAVYG
ncbi:MAG TPA: co-chaperone GroES [Chlamydiales bacterium]|nr:co-chaperone GroES [Chlamydiales bacterium]